MRKISIALCVIFLAIVTTQLFVLVTKAGAEGKTYILWRNDRNILPKPPMFSSKVPPVLTVDPGDIVVFETRGGGGEQVLPPSSTDRTIEEEVAQFDMDAPHPLTGPVFIRGAAEGDILKVEVLDVVPGSYAAVWIDPNLGFLPKEFNKPYKHTFILNYPREEYVDFGYGIRFKLEPMAGCAGVVPKPPKETRTPPPGEWGGNMDNNDFRRGATWYFPVFFEGALFSTGDTHARQGEGEVCITGMEGPCTVHLKFDVIKGKAIPEPQYEMPDFYATTGTGQTMEEAGQKAVRAMLDFLEWKFGLPRHEAYMLCSIVGNLRVSEVVDPTIQMNFKIPKDIFVHGAPVMYSKQ